MKPTIALFIADPKCSVQSANGIIASLGSDYNFKIFSKNELENNFFENVDMVAVPGGFGDSESFQYLFKHNKERVLNFVQKGGKYLGICMGAYWAGDHYFKMLDSVDAVQYIKRPDTDTKRPHAKAIEIKWNGHPDRMFFYDGCALVGDSTKFRTIATYANGDAMAIIQNNIGLIGCHPESEKFWYDSYSWMGKHWHDNAHHTILLEFVNEMFT
jgi:hypothetical protein